MNASNNDYWVHEIACVQMDAETAHARNASTCGLHRERAVRNAKAHRIRTETI